MVRSETPYCGGPPLEQLTASYLTPVDRFFVRSHGTVPKLNRETHRVTVDGLVRRRLSLTVPELLDRFPRREAVVTLQCAGNRRNELLATAPIPGEVPWGAEAISNARWSGVSLVDVLGAAGVEAEAQHVAFEGLDSVERQGRTFGFGGSVSVTRALAGDLLLADRMDDKPLPAHHGYPLRVVVPGFIGARSVKWLSRITLHTEPSDNYFEAHAYKLLPPDADPATVDWPAYSPLEEMPIGAVICVPAPGAVLDASALRVTGYATSRGHDRVLGVDVSADDGATWQPAQLLDRAGPGTWVRWQVALNLAPGAHELVARVRDSGRHEQPEHAADAWNPKGYMNEAWHRIRVVVSRSEGDPGNR
jgi:sulfite oxidase